MKILCRFVNQFLMCHLLEKLRENDFLKLEWGRYVLPELLSEYDNYILVDSHL